MNRLLVHDDPLRCDVAPTRVAARFQPGDIPVNGKFRPTRVLHPSPIGGFRPPTANSTLCKALGTDGYVQAPAEQVYLVRSLSCTVTTWSWSSTSSTSRVCFGASQKHKISNLCPTHCCRALPMSRAVRPLWARVTLGGSVWQVLVGVLLSDIVIHVQKADGAYTRPNEPRADPKTQATASAILTSRGPTGNLLPEAWSALVIDRKKSRLLGS